MISYLRISVVFLAGYLTGCGQESTFNSGTIQTVKEKADQRQIRQVDEYPDELDATADMTGSETQAPEMSPAEAAVAGSSTSDSGQESPGAAEATEIAETMSETTDSLAAEADDPELTDDQQAQLALDEGIEKDADEDNAAPAPEIKIESFIIENSKAFHLGNNKLGNSKYFNTDCEDRNDILAIPTAGETLTLEVEVPADTIWTSMSVKSICGLDTTGSLDIKTYDGASVSSLSLKKLQGTLETGELNLGAGIYHITITAGYVFGDLDDILLDDLNLTYTGSGDQPVTIVQIP